jgi:hypothetical protein
VGRHFGMNLPLPAGKGPEAEEGRVRSARNPDVDHRQGRRKEHRPTRRRAGAPARDWLRPQIAAEGQDSVSYFSSSIVTATAPMADSRTLLPSTSATRFLSMKRWWPLWLPSPLSFLVSLMRLLSTLSTVPT